MYRYFKRIAGVGTGNYIYYWLSKGLSDEKINSVEMPNDTITPYLSYYGPKPRVELNGSCLKQDKITYTNGIIINIVYEIAGGHSSNDNYPALQKALLGAVKLTKNADIDKYEYSCYGLGSSFSFLAGGFGLNVIILRVDMSLSTKIDNRKKDFLILGKGPTHELEHALTVEKCIQLILATGIQNVGWACIITEQIVIYLLMALEL